MADEDDAGYNPSMDDDLVGDGDADLAGEYTGDIDEEFNQQTEVSPHGFASHRNAFTAKT